ncbi:MAG: PstS family phosphate ABC transporter substrate-binding protein [Fimbriimonadia bacterium]|jgi:phosphate transport system substrate-binding protein
MVQAFGRNLWLGGLALVGIAIVAGCGGASTSESGEKSGSKLSGSISIDGSSTVYPISEAAAEEFMKENPDVRASVGTSGTGGGFKKFVAGETDISDASRPIQIEEMEIAKKNGIEFIELPVAFDGLSVVVHKDNDFVDYLTVEELKRIWEPGSKVQYWSDVRPNWPRQKIRLFGPGTDSGTYDYFTEAVVGEQKKCRPDFQPSEDDNVLVQGVSGEKYALGYFGYAYYAENADKLKVVPIDGGSGPITPTEETIRNGQYTPLARPLFIYVSTKAAERPEVQAFIKFYMQNAEKLVAEVKYVPLPANVYEIALERFEKRKTGSVFEGKHQVGLSLEQLMKTEEESQ